MRYKSYKDTYQPPMLGDKFPEMQVMTTQGIKKLPDDYKDHWWVLFSHPGDFTPVCTSEFVAFAENEANFKKLNTKILALSLDQLQAHLKWIEWIDNNTHVTINFPIIADSLGKHAKQLGMIAPNMGTSTVRKLFIIDPKGKIRLTMTYPPSAGRNVDEVIRAIYALQMGDKHKLAAPENYPNNKWLGENTLIVPPPTTQRQTMLRLQGQDAGNYECKDWWMCYKKF